MTSRRYGLR